MARLPPQADRPRTSSSRVSTGDSFTEECGSFRKELAVPGYWKALEQNCSQWADEISVSPFWKEVDKRQPTWSNEFQRRTAGALLANPGIPKFVGKSAKRIREKLAHRSRDERVPISEMWPKSGPPVPFLNDLVRTRIECQFLDGVEFVGTSLEALAKECGVKCSRERQGLLEGYFAQHFLFEQPVFFRWGGGEEPTTVKCEIQIATLLATRIWEESHRIYETWRTREEDAQDWQWNPNDPRFVARQLGHMIHLADGLLVQLRNNVSSSA